MNRICFALFIGDHFDSCNWVFLIILKVYPMIEVAMR